MLQLVFDKLCICGWSVGKMVLVWTLQLLMISRKTYEWVVPMVFNDVKTVLPALVLIKLKDQSSEKETT